MAEEVFQNAREQINPAAHILLFIKFHFDAMTANKTDAVFGNHAGEMAAAFDAEDSRNLLFAVTGLAEGVETQNLLKRFFALFIYLYLFERKLRYKEKLF